MASSGGSSNTPRALPLSYVRSALLAIPPPNTTKYQQFEARFKANLISTAHLRAPGYLKQARQALLPVLRHELLEFDRHMFARRYNITEKDQDRRQHLVRTLDALRRLIRSEDEVEERERRECLVGAKGPYESASVGEDSKGSAETAEREEEGAVVVTKELVSYLREGPRGDTQPYVYDEVRRTGTEKEDGKVAGGDDDLESGLEEVYRQLEMCQLDGGDDRDDDLPRLDKGKGKAEDEDEDEEEGGGSDSASDESELGAIGELIYAAIENRFPMLELKAARAEVEAARKRAEAYAAADQHRPVFSVTERQDPRSVTSGPSTSFSMLGLPNLETPLSTTPNISPPSPTPLPTRIPTTAKYRKIPNKYSRRKQTGRNPPTSIMGHAATRRDPTYLSPPSQANSTTRSPPPLKTEAGVFMNAQDTAVSANDGAAMAESSEETRLPMTKSAKKRERLKRKAASVNAPIDPKLEKEKKAAKKLRQAATKRREAERVKKAQDGDEVCGEEALDMSKATIDEPEDTSDNLQEDESEKTQADNEVCGEEVQAEPDVLIEKLETPSDKSQDEANHSVDFGTSNSNVDLSNPAIESSGLTPPKMESSDITLPKEEDETLSSDSSDSDSSDGTLPKVSLEDNLHKEEEDETRSSDSDSSEDSADPTPLPTSPGPDDRTMYPNLYIDAPTDLPFMVPFVLKTPPISPPRHIVKAWHLGIAEVQARVEHYSKASRLAIEALEHLYGSPVPIVEAAKQKCRDLNRLHREALMESTRIWFMMADWQVEQVGDAATVDPEAPEGLLMVSGKGGLWPEWFYRSAIKRNRYRQRCETWDMTDTDWTLEWRGDGWYPKPPGKEHENDFESCDLCEDKRDDLEDPITEVVMNDMIDFFNRQKGNLDGYDEEAKEMLTRTIDNCIGGQRGFYQEWVDFALEEPPWEVKSTAEAEREPEHSPNVDDEQGQEEEEEETEGQPEKSDSHRDADSEASGSVPEKADSDKASPPPSEVRLGKKKIAADPFSEDPNAWKPEAPKPKKKSKKKKHHTRKKKTGGVSKESANADSDAESHSSSKTIRASSSRPKVARLYGIGKQRVTMAVHPSSSNQEERLNYIPPRPPPNEYPRGDCPSDSESDTSHGPSYPDPPLKPWTFPDAVDVYSELPPYPAFRFRVGHGFQVITYPNQEEMDVIAPYKCVRVPGANPRQQHTQTFIFNYKNSKSKLPMFWVTDVIEKIMIDHDIIQVPVLGGGYVRAWGPPVYGKWVSVSWPQDVEKPRSLIIDLVEKIHKRRSIWNQGSFEEWIEKAMERAPDYREGEWQRKWQRKFDSDW